MAGGQRLLAALMAGTRHSRHDLLKCSAASRVTCRERMANMEDVTWEGRQRAATERCRLSCLHIAFARIAFMTHDSYEHKHRSADCESSFWGRREGERRGLRGIQDPLSRQDRRQGRVEARRQCGVLAVRADLRMSCWSLVVALPNSPHPLECEHAVFPPYLFSMSPGKLHVRLFG